MSLAGINAYKKGSLKQDIAAADPHKLTLMLLQGTLDQIAYMKGAMERKDYAAKSANVTKVVSILTYLRDTLDFEAGGDFAENLASLYNYVIDRVNAANLANSIEMLDECYQLLEPICSAWRQIPESAKQQAYSQKSR